MYFRGLLNCRMEAAQQVVCLAAARPRHAIGSHGVDCQSVKQMSFYENTRIGTLFSEVSVLFNMVQCARRSSTAYDNIAVFADLVTSGPAPPQNERLSDRIRPSIARKALRSSLRGPQ